MAEVSHLDFHDHGHLDGEGRRLNPHHPDHKQKTTKSGTVAERIVWMTRTSDSFGSYMKTDLDDYLSLIRRKIQEKCSTTADLINQIRRFKIGESQHVTPMEFRYTLIKFGIALPQTLVDRIFNVFDSDRSGSMDFDEFAMWIMNSEFRPALQRKKATNDGIDSPRTTLRKKMQECVKQHPNTFQNMKQQVSFLEFVSEMNRAHMPLTEKDARNIYQILDPRDTGYIESASVVKWANTGIVDRRNPREQAALEEAANRGQMTEQELRQVINRVVGRNTRQLENSFAHIEMGKGTKLPFEEFRRCLLNSGVSKNMYDMKQLFLALGGRESGRADIDLFFKHLSPIIVDPAMEVSNKRAATAISLTTMSISRADRRLRDSLRKGFKEVKHDIERLDKMNTGFITAEQLYRILTQKCTPLSFEDYRFIIQQVNKEPGTNRIDYNHFFHAYNPLNYHHQLTGLNPLKSYDPNAEEEDPYLHQQHHHHQTHSRGMKSLSKSMSAVKPFALNDIHPPNNNNSQPTSSNNQTLSNSISVPSLKSKALDDINIGTKTLNMAATIEPNNNPELKKIWQGVLRECHRADPERSGQVSRNAFIAALEKADTAKTMTAQHMNKLADDYTLSNGLVNYLLLFRQYLQELTNRPATSFQSGDKSSSMTKTKSLPYYDSLTKAAEPGPVHPWQFGYERKRHPVHPYWHTAASIHRDANTASNAASNGDNGLRALSMKLASLSVPSSTEKEAEDLTSQEKEALLSQYNSKVLALCAKSYKMFLPIWRQLRNEFKKNQIPSQRGSILTDNFLAVLEANGLVLSKTDLGTILKSFRGYGMQDIVRFDDFLRVCMLVKDQA